MISSVTTVPTVKCVEIPEAAINGRNAMSKGKGWRKGEPVAEMRSYQLDTAEDGKVDHASAARR